MIWFMGLIAPKTPAIAGNRKENAKILDQALADIALQPSTDEEGVVRNNAYRLAWTLWQTAMYAESPKDRTSAAKLIYERVRGKPAVVADEEKEEIPEITIRVNPKTAEQIKALSERNDVEEDDSEGKVVVEIDGEPRMEF